MLIGGRIDEEDDTAYVPIRRFDDNVLVQPSGHSLIAQLMDMGDRLVIEDIDLTSYHLRRHIDNFGLDELRVTDVSSRQRMRGASLVLVEKNG